MSPGLSWMSSNTREVSPVGSNLTVEVGAQAEFEISGSLSVTTGVGFAFNRGATLRHETGGNFFPKSRLSNDSYNTGQKPLPDGTRLKYHLHYLQFPFALKWHVQPSDDLKYYAEAPILTWGFTTQRRADIKAGDIQAAKENVSKDVNPLNLSLGIGGGIEYAISSKTSAVLGLSFHRGLLDVTSDKATKAIPDPDHNPFDPNDDYFIHKENANAVLNAFVLRMGILF